MKQVEFDSTEQASQITKVKSKKIRNLKLEEIASNLKVLWESGLKRGRDFSAGTRGQGLHRARRAALTLTRAPSRSGSQVRIRRINRLSVMRVSQDDVFRVVFGGAARRRRTAYKKYRA